MPKSDKIWLACWLAKFPGALLPDQPASSELLAGDQFHLVNTCTLPHDLAEGSPEGEAGFIGSLPIFSGWPGAVVACVDVPLNHQIKCPTWGLLFCSNRDVSLGDVHGHACNLLSIPVICILGPLHCLSMTNTAGRSYWAIM